MSEVEEPLTHEDTGGHRRVPPVMTGARLVSKYARELRQYAQKKLYTA